MRTKGFKIRKDAPITKRWAQSIANRMLINDYIASERYWEMVGCIEAEIRELATNDPGRSHTLTLLLDSKGATIGTIEDRLDLLLCAAPPSPAARKAAAILGERRRKLDSTTAGGASQDHILALLKEASNPQISAQRENQIQVELSHAAELPPGEEFNAQSLINALYAGATEHSRKALPSLFPAFAIACGTRKDGMLCAPFPTKVQA
jgi:hypothetical protein